MLYVLGFLYGRVTPDWRQCALSVTRMDLNVDRLWKLTCSGPPWVHQEMASVFLNDADDGMARMGVPYSVLDNAMIRPRLIIFLVK